MTSKNVIKTILLTATSMAIFAAPASFAADPGSFDKFRASAPTSSVNIDYSPIEKFSAAFGRKERGRTKISYAAVEQKGQKFPLSQ